MSDAIQVSVRRACSVARVRVVETGEVFASVTEAAARHGVYAGAIIKSNRTGCPYRRVHYVLVHRRRRPRANPTFHAPRWTPEIDRLLIEWAATATHAEIAQRVYRSRCSVIHRCQVLGLTKTRPHHGSRFDALIDRGAQDGMSNSAIAELCSRTSETPVSVKFVAVRRHRLSLPNVAAGVRRAWSDRAVELGWPVGTKPRELQVLHTLYLNGPMTLPEIASVWGVVEGKQQTIYGHVLSRLIQRGLLLSLGRVPQAGSSRGRGMYSLPLHVGPQSAQPTEECYCHAR